MDGKQGNYITGNVDHLIKVLNLVLTLTNMKSSIEKVKADVTARLPNM